MNNFKRVFVIIALVFALSLGVFTTAFANEDTNAPENDEGEITNPEVTPDEPSERDKLLADRLAAIEAGTPLKQYNLPVVVGPLTWEDGNPETQNWKKSGTTVTTTWGQILSDVGVNDIGVETLHDGDNAYLIIRYNGEAEKEYEKAYGTIHSYPYINVKDRTQENNLVIEFDITSFGDAYPAMGIEHSTVSRDDGSRAQPRILEIKPDGSISASFNGTSQSKYKLTAEEQERMSAVRLGFDGEWTHITLLYESDTCFVSLYVDYEYIARWDTRPTGVSHYKLDIFRTGTANGDFAQAEAAIDNFIAYEGSYIRTTDLFENMSEPERFMYYSGYSMNDSAPNADRVVAYRQAGQLVNKYYDGEFIPVEDESLGAEELAKLNERLLAAVETFNAFSADGYANIYNQYITDNLTAFGALIDGFRSTQVRTLDSIDSRRAALAEIDAFLKDCGEDILKSEDSDYLVIKGAYDTISAEITNDLNIVEFCLRVDRFYSASPFGADVMQKHYQNATNVYELISDRAVMDSEGFERFKTAVELYKAGNELLQQKIREKNSKVIIDCIGFISEYTTQEQWDANYNYVNKYVVIVRDVVREGNYDASASGIDEALEFFNLVNGYFYNLLQIEHAEYIGAMLDNYLAATGYVEKVGICAHIRAYIASSDISLEHELVAPKVLALSIYEGELEQYQDDYNDVLKQNTVIFKNTVNLMSTANGYAELLTLYNKAQELYFAMNVGDETIANELAIFDRMTFQLEAMEQASKQFLVLVELLRSATDADERYAALVSCYLYASDADMQYEGVAAAMEYYLAEYNAYNNAAKLTVGEISAMNSVAVGSVRANCGTNEIVAVIVKKVTDAE